MGSRLSTPSDDCGLCRRVVTANGDRQRYSPGCCNKWYHQDCLTNLVNGGGTMCPHCKTPLPQNFLSTTIPAANVIYAQAAPAPPGKPASQMNQNSPPRPEDLVLPWTPPTDSSIQSAIEHSKIRIECTPETRESSLSGNNKFHVLVTMSCLDNEAEGEVEATAVVSAETKPSAPSDDSLLKNGDAPLATLAPSPSSQPSRPPLDIICVLDTSGSMSSDNKLKNLIYAVDYIRGELSEFDRMAVITFETSAVEVHQLLRLNDNNKAYTASLCQGLRPGGGTTILSGLKAASAMIQRRQTQNPITSVFLLTDGVDGSHVSEKKRVAQEIKESGASLFVYGFGADHDSKHLKMIADAASGTFTFIEKSDMVIDAFGGALGGEQSIFATNICLTIAAGPSESEDSKGESSGVMITSAEAGSYKKEVHPSGSYTKVFFNNIMLGEERDVLVSLALPPSSSSTGFDQTLLHTSVSFSPVGSREAILTRSGGDCVISRVSQSELSAASTQRDERVDVQVNRMLFVEATKESLNYADKGDYENAKTVVEKTMAEIRGSSSMATQNMKTKAFVDELGSTLSNVRDRDVYQTKGGRALLSQQNQDYGLQRQAYAREGVEGVYQNKCAKSSQARAKTTKSSWM